MYGSFNVLNVYLQGKLDINPTIISAIVGSIGGLVLSLGGSMLDFPTKVFKLHDTSYIVHILAPILYSIIFSLIIQPLNNRYLN